MVSFARLHFDQKNVHSWLTLKVVLSAQWVFCYLDCSMLSCCYWSKCQGLIAEQSL